MKFSFHTPKFIKSSVKPKDYPILRASSGKLIPEIAVVGRSNVGKSSLLNDLFQTKHLVKTSATPGKTQLINFFTLNDQLAFADLPGYGYAKVPREMRSDWGDMIQTYLEKRENLKLILYLFDIRRLPNEEDRMLVDWIAQQDQAMIMIMTKVDKVSKNERKGNTDKIIAALGAGNIHFVHYSTLKHIGRKELIHMIQDAFLEEEKESYG